MPKETKPESTKERKMYNLEKKPLSGGNPPTEHIIKSKEKPKSLFNRNNEEMSVIKTNPEVPPGASFFKKFIKDHIEKLEKTYIRKQRQPLNKPSKVPEERLKKIKPELTTPLYARSRFNFV